MVSALPTEGGDGTVMDDGLGTHGSYFPFIDYEPKISKFENNLNIEH
jgi:hypothetical protein